MSTSNPMDLAPDAGEDVSRREFLLRLGLTTALIAGTGLAARKLWQPKHFVPGFEKEVGLQLRSYAPEVSKVLPSLAIAHGTEHEKTIRWRVAIKDKALDGLRECKLIQTLPEHFLAALQSGTVATNVYLRRIHHFAVAMHWLPWPVLPKLHWPPIQFAHKRAVTLDEHRKLMARETSPARRAFYELLWHFGGSQSDMARLTAEDIDWQRQTVAYVRCKTGTPAVQAFGPEVVAILRTLPTAGPLFPTLAEQTPGDRAAFFNYQMRKLGISGVTLHSYRYAWAERAKVAGYPERFAMQAMGHASKAVHRAYAKSAEVVLPPLEDYEAPKGNAPAPVAGVLPEGSRN
jgi:integrase